MRQKILVFISILILNCFSVQAEETSLPKLPALPSTNITESGDVASGDQLSFIEKIKNFFGFGDDESDSASDPYAETKEQEINSGDKLISTQEVTSSTPKEQSLFEKAKNLLGLSDDEKNESTASTESPIDQKVSNNAEKEAIPVIDDFQISDLPAGSSDEGPMSAQLPMTINNEGEKEIQLPSGFDDMKDNSVPEVPATTTDETPASPKMDETEKLELPSGFDEVKDSSETTDVLTDTMSSSAEKLELPSGFDDMKDDSAPKASDAITEEATAALKMDGAEKLELPSGFDDMKDDSAPKVSTTPTKLIDAMLDSANGPEVASLDDADQKIMENADAKEEGGHASNIPALSLPEAPNVSAAPKLELPSSDNSGLTVPSYVAEADATKTLETNISKYTKELESKQTAKSVDKISSEELTAGNNNIEKYTEVTSAGLDEAQLKFIDNEAQVLILPNDDVVLGKLTKEARFDVMDLRSYVKIFWEKYNKIKRQPQRRIIDKFIKDYDENFNEEKHLYYEDEARIGLNEAFKAIHRENIYSLISLLNSYPILQLTGDDNNTLLHEAAYIGNYSAARLLVLKGINVFVNNTDNQTALNVAEKFSNQHITFLLKSSDLK